MKSKLVYCTRDEAHAWTWHTFDEAIDDVNMAGEEGLLYT